MFGFFKKKSGEVPEEQERLQKAAAREAERKEAPAIPEELRALGQKFLPEEFSILAVTGAGGFGGSRLQENGPWLAVLELTAWKEEDSDQPAHRERTQLVALADDKLMGLPPPPGAGGQRLSDHGPPLRGRKAVLS